MNQRRGPFRGNRPGRGRAPMPPGPRRGPVRRPSREALEPVPDGMIEEWLLEARELAEKGAIRTAMEKAGEAVGLDTERPEGYLLLGELNLLDGDPDEALRTFTAARAKAAKSRPDFLQEPAEVRILAATGEGHALRVLGRPREAAEAYAAALAEDPSDPLGLAAPCCESWLLAGQPDRAAAFIPPLEGATPDAHLVAAFASLRRGDRSAFVVRARLALLGNLYLLSALISGDTPDLGLVHGIEDAGPEAALRFAERLKPVVEADPLLLDALAAVASAPGPADDMERFRNAASRLMREPDPAARVVLMTELDRLRDPIRIEATTPDVLSDWEFTDSTHGGGSVDV